MERALLLLHVGGGVAAITTGYAALFVMKGGPTHRVSGKAFVGVMTVTAVTASVLGFLHDDVGDVFGGIMAVYFIVTAWVAAKRRDGEVGLFELGAFVVAATLVGINLYFAILAGRANDGRFLGFPAVQYCVVAGIMGLAAVSDLRVVLAAGLTGRRRIARHLWRMCVGLFIAVGSFFLGQMQVFPEPIRRVEFLSIPVGVVIALMLFWLVRVRFTKWWPPLQGPPGDIGAPRN